MFEKSRGRRRWCGQPLRVVGLGRDGTLHGTYESRSCLFLVGRPVSRKAGRKKAPPSVSALGLLHLMDVSLKASLTLSSLAFLEIIQHFLSFGKYSKSGPSVLRTSHRFLISVVEPAPLASSANQHCFTLTEDDCILVIKG